MKQESTYIESLKRELAFKTARIESLNELVEALKLQAGTVTDAWNHTECQYAKLEKKYKELEIRFALLSREKKHTRKIIPEKTKMRIVKFES